MARTMIEALKMLNRANGLCEEVTSIMGTSEKVSTAAKRSRKEAAHVHMAREDTRYPDVMQHRQEKPERTLALAPTIDSPPTVHPVIERAKFSPDAIKLLENIEKARPGATQQVVSQLLRHQEAFKEGVSTYAMFSSASLRHRRCGKSRIREAQNECEGVGSLLQQLPNKT